MTDTTADLPPFTGDAPRCAQCGHRGAVTEYRPHGRCLHPTEAVMGFDPNPRLHRTCDRCGHVWDEATAQQTREDGHAGACDATEATDAPEPTDAPNGRQAGAQDREQWSAIIAAEVDPDYAAQQLLALRDQDRAAHDEWTRAVEKRNTRLRAELREARATLDRVRAECHAIGNDTCNAAARILAVIDQPDDRP